MSRFAGLTALAAATLWPTMAPGQSMNVPYIVDSVMGEVCAPYARSGDIEAAVRAAEALGYQVIEGESALLLDREPPAGLVRLSRRHHGTVTLSLDYGRGLCSVGINEGGASNMAPAAEPYMRGLGLEPVSGLNDHDGAVVWRSKTAEVVIARSPRFTPGSELVLTFEVPGREP